MADHELVRWEDSVMKYGNRSSKSATFVPAVFLENVKQHGMAATRNVSLNFQSDNEN
jgi:hypothetical protein